MKKNSKKNNVVCYAICLRSQVSKSASFPVHKLTSLLDHDNKEMRAEFREFLSDPVMTPR